MKRFPTGKYGKQTLKFYPAPFRAPLRAFAALVFPWKEDEILICDIVDRGWSIPSGRVEPNESSEQAVRREALEEAGAIIDNLIYIGCYEILERGETRWADCFAATVEDLVEIGIQTESRAVMYADMAQLAEVYHLWNDLTEHVFEHSREILKIHERFLASS